VSLLLKSLKQIQSQRAVPLDPEPAVSVIDQPLEEQPIEHSFADPDPIAFGSQTAEKLDLEAVSHREIALDSTSSPPSSTLDRLNELEALMAAEWGAMPAVKPQKLPAQEPLRPVKLPVTAALNPPLECVEDVPQSIASDVVVPVLAPENMTVTSVEAVAPTFADLATQPVPETTPVFQLSHSSDWNNECTANVYIPSPVARDEIRTEVSPPEAEPSIRVPVTAAVVTNTPATVPLRDEYAQLRDHLFSQFALRTPCTILFVDAGNSAQDAAWLMPLAISFWQHLGAHSAASTNEACTGHSVPRVLIVDSAGTPSALTQALGIESPRGLTDVVLETAELAAAIQPTPHPHIDLLAAGTSPLPSNMAGRLSQIWNDLRKDYDVLLVAAGPWNRQHGSVGCNPSSLVGLAQAVLLCVEIDSTARPLASQTADDLRQRGANLLGCVVRN
jgi:hypothetical protein